MNWALDSQRDVLGGERKWEDGFSKFGQTIFALSLQVPRQHLVDSFRHILSFSRLSLP
jgi:hypothetical protein